VLEFVPALDERSVCRIEKLAGEIWREYYIPIIGAAQVEYMLERLQSVPALNFQISRGFLYYLLKIDGEFSGYFAVLPEKDKERLFLSKIYLLSSARGKGCGRRTLEFIETLAGPGLNRISLTVNKGNIGAIGAYLKCGFTISGTQVTDIGGGFVMDDYLMEKSV